MNLTQNQLWVLRRLSEAPNYGLNPHSFGGQGACARRMAKRGLVELNRMSHYHIRYRLTDAGWAAITPACRQCSVCEGQDHHWMYVGDEDEAGEPVISCKHCEATRAIQDDDE